MTDLTCQFVRTSTIFDYIFPDIILIISLLVIGIWGCVVLKNLIK